MHPPPSTRQLRKRIHTPAPPRPCPPSARLCRKQGPLEVQTLITELEYFSKLRGMAPGDKRKQRRARSGVGRWGEPVRPGRRRRGWGLGWGRPRASRKSTPPPTRKARRPLQAAPGEGERPCRRGPPWGRGGTGGQRCRTFLSGPEQRSLDSSTS